MAYTPQDRFFKKAKQDGYRSRAAYKLIELQQRFRLMNQGDKVVDLGAAPGGWLQIAAKLVGPNGKIVGVDLQPIQPFQEPNIVLLQGNALSIEILARIKEVLGDKANCVLSDMAPKLSGIRDADRARCQELNQTALQAAKELLRPGGVLLVKSFVSEYLQTYTAELKKHFITVQRTKPDATRESSSEFYFFAKGYQPQTTAALP
jgi:23S rRNA (uridine2552-2'-O)-methyltransferase